MQMLSSFRSARPVASEPSPIAGASEGDGVEPSSPPVARVAEGGGEGNAFGSEDQFQGFNNTEVHHLRFPHDALVNCDPALSPATPMPDPPVASCSPAFYLDVLERHGLSAHVVRDMDPALLSEAASHIFAGDHILPPPRAIFAVLGPAARGRAADRDRAAELQRSTLLAAPPSVSPLLPASLGPVPSSLRYDGSRSDGQLVSPAAFCERFQRYYKGQQLDERTIGILLASALDGEAAAHITGLPDDPVYGPAWNQKLQACNLSFTDYRQALERRFNGLVDQ